VILSQGVSGSPGRRGSKGVAGKPVGSRFLIICSFTGIISYFSNTNK